MEIKPVDESKDPKYGKITLQKGIREYNAGIAEHCSSWGLGGLVREQEPTLDEILDSYTLDQLRKLYDAKRCTDIHQLEQDIKDAENDIRSFTAAYQDLMNYRKERIARLEDMLKSPECKDPSAILHNLEIQKASIEVESKEYRKDLSAKETHRNQLNLRMLTYNCANRWSLSTLKRKAADKFGVDISKPKPHPDALRDPLYHDDVTDKI